MKEGSLGIDVGSVSTNLVVIDKNDNIVEKIYLRTGGRPINALKKGMSMLSNHFEDAKITASGTTGSGRQLAGALIGADVVKNEITAHAVAACRIVPNVHTILEIGGQDSKIIFLKDGVVCDFAMNTVCAAGTGSFLDRQASRLEIPIEEFGSYALRSKSPVRIAGRCAVFGESDMISKQQTGHSNEDIIAGLCDAMVRNYLCNLAKGKEIAAPIIFQGGVAANIGIVAAFEKALIKKVIIPQHYDVMGAYGAAILAKEEVRKSNKTTRFFGFGHIKQDFMTRSFECRDCTNRCEVIQIKSDHGTIAHWGDRCGKWGGAGVRNQNNSKVTTHNSCPKNVEEIVKTKG
ncbi:MAG: acyl-CoA dehydratase activase [Eubacteriales bacterium]|nr:acyl-CoA dehydratase activase [Eubacteriales bacterium]